ncbi:hypothetical protein G5B37_09715 [Rasiella rasia]|uniref:Uncharacterized protein n=1 Tax=Rasiella rasia TaxID=2744027 RepID=A0A6G6GQ39_9FLAO|nr:hypothetical protein [Rasiella rasia]QIE59831.1 hypothetical protein G5B37_09715 [Rasiella rasia]
MKALSIAIAFFFVAALQVSETATANTEINKTEIVTPFASFKLINDTGDKVSIHTGSGFVSLNKGGSTSITCNKGKEVRWAKSGKKGSVIFKISGDHCGKTIKLSEYL